VAYVKSIDDSLCFPSKDQKPGPSYNDKLFVFVVLAKHVLKDIFSPLVLDLLMLVG